MCNPHSFQKCCHFCWLCFDFSENDNTFERNEDCATAFLKWTDFTNEIFDSFAKKLYYSKFLCPVHKNTIITNLNFIIWSKSKQKNSRSLWLCSNLTLICQTWCFLVEMSMKIRLIKFWYVIIVSCVTVRETHCNHFYFRCQAKKKFIYWVHISLEPWHKYWFFGLPS